MVGVPGFEEYPDYYNIDYYDYLSYDYPADVANQPGPPFQVPNPDSTISETATTTTEPREAIQQTFWT